MSQFYSSRLVSSRLVRQFSLTVLASAVNIVLALSCQSVHADESFWGDTLSASSGIATNQENRTERSLPSQLEKYRELNLDEQRLDAQLAIASKCADSKRWQDFGNNTQLTFASRRFC